MFYLSKKNHYNSQASIFVALFNSPCNVSKYCIFPAALILKRNICKLIYIFGKFRFSFFYKALV